MIYQNCEERSFEHPNPQSVLAQFFFSQTDRPMANFYLCIPYQLYTHIITNMCVYLYFLSSIKYTLTNIIRYFFASIRLSKLRKYFITENEILNRKIYFFRNRDKVSLRAYKILRVPILEHFYIIK